MRTTWEYARLQLTCDPGKNPYEFHGLLGLPGTTSWHDLGILDSVTATLNDLGSEGWELVGTPSDLNAVYTYQAANETYHDRAYTVERCFWFKRPAAS
ncbi:hypothetical protein ACQP00_23005 [Dactylosporangium sp. CS-047395]|uniref:hypothetical protein n=1 Tax=Dactylosporangium sp. CS-047395 TaxID=3239936 RepID=UPI003D8F84E7